MINTIASVNGIIIIVCCFGWSALQTKDFEKLLLESIDEGLSLLGESSRQAIYFHLEQGCDLKREEIPEKIEAFASAIHSIFGLGASCLEILIMKQLYQKVGGLLELDEARQFQLTEYVNALRENLTNKRTKRKSSKVIVLKEVDLEI